MYFVTFSGKVLTADTVELVPTRISHAIWSWALQIEQDCAVTGIGVVQGYIPRLFPEGMAAARPLGGSCTERWCWRTTGTWWPWVRMLLMQLSTACVSCVRDQITIEHNEFQAWDFEFKGSFREVGKTLYSHLPGEKIFFYESPVIVQVPKCLPSDSSKGLNPKQLCQVPVISRNRALC